MIPYEWVDGRGKLLFQDWPDLEVRQRRQLRVLLIELERVDYEVANGSLIFKMGGRKLAGIYYSKINGNVALRPRCCVGPELTRTEFEEERKTAERRKTPPPTVTTMSPQGRGEIVTYLERVTKKDGNERPRPHDSVAPARMADIAEDRARRRRITLHHQKEHQA